MFQLLTQQLQTCKGNRSNAVVVVGKQSGKINYRYSYKFIYCDLQNWGFINLHYC